MAPPGPVQSRGRLVIQFFRFGRRHKGSTYQSTTAHRPATPKGTNINQGAPIADPSGTAIRKANPGLNVQRLRRDKGLSQEELASRAEMHQTYLSGVERGVRNASIQVLARIAKALGVDVEELVKRRSRCSWSGLYLRVFAITRGCCAGAV